MKTKALVAGILLLVSLSLFHFFHLLFADPISAAEKEADKLGWSQPDRVVSAGGYSSGLLNYDAYLRFHSKTHPEVGEISVLIHKPSPFHSWQLREYNMEHPLEEM